MPFGKIILESEVLIWRHLIEEGSPPKTWENDREEQRTKKRIQKKLRDLGIIDFLK